MPAATQGRDTAEAVDVSLDEVSAEAALRRDRPLEVDLRTPREAPEGRFPEAHGKRLHGEAARVDIGDRLTGTVHRDRVPECEVAEHPRSIDGDLSVLGASFDPPYRSDLLNQPGEHRLPPAPRPEPTRATRRESPRARAARPGPACGPARGTGPPTSRRRRAGRYPPRLRR